MISEKGRSVAVELYDELDGGLRERSSRSVAKHISLDNMGVEISSKIEKLSDKRYRVTLRAIDERGELMKLELSAASLPEAEEISDNYRRNPTGVYRGILFSATGKMDFLA